MPPLATPPATQETSGKLPALLGCPRRPRRPRTGRTRQPAYPDGHPHQLHHTAAVEWLRKGVPLEEVSKLLGHSSIKTTEKHYAPWVKSRQDRLDELVMGTWEGAANGQMSFDEALAFLASLGRRGLNTGLTEREKSELTKLATRIKGIVEAAGREDW